MHSNSRAHSIRGRKQAPGAANVSYLIALVWPRPQQSGVGCTCLTCHSTEYDTPILTAVQLYSYGTPSHAVSGSRQELRYQMLQLHLRVLPRHNLTAVAGSTFFSRGTSHVVEVAAPGAHCCLQKASAAAGPGIQLLQGNERKIQQRAKNPWEAGRCKSTVTSGCAATT